MVVTAPKSVSLRFEPRIVRSVSITSEYTPWFEKLDRILEFEGKGFSEWMREMCVQYVTDKLGTSV